MITLGVQCLFYPFYLYLYMVKSYIEGYPPSKDLKNELCVAVLNI